MDRNVVSIDVADIWQRFDLRKVKGYCHCGVCCRLHLLTWAVRTLHLQPVRGTVHHLGMYRPEPSKTSIRMLLWTCYLIRLLFVNKLLMLRIYAPAVHMPRPDRLCTTREGKDASWCKWRFTTLGCGRRPHSLSEILSRLSQRASAQVLPKHHHRVRPPYYTQGHQSPTQHGRTVGSPWHP